MGLGLVTAQPSEEERRARRNEILYVVGVSLVIFLAMFGTWLVAL